MRNTKWAISEKKLKNLIARNMELYDFYKLNISFKGDYAHVEAWTPAEDGYFTSHLYISRTDANGNEVDLLERTIDAAFIQLQTHEIYDCIKANEITVY